MKDSRAITSFPSNPRRCFLVCGILLVLLLCLLAGCGRKRVLKENPHRQHFLDVTDKYIPAIPGKIQMALFLRGDRGRRDDLVLLVQTKTGARLKVLINQGKKKFIFKKSGRTAESVEKKIRFIAAGDINRDGTSELVVIVGEGPNARAHLLLNNGKGYFYLMKNLTLPPVFGGIQRVDIVDIDQDGDLDLFFTGTRVLDPSGATHKLQAQIMTNDGTGRFEDESSLLLPRMKPGIVGTSFADYDGDGVRDIFLVYGNGQNRLLINNGLGQFTDQTKRSLPRILDQSTSADWADFDQDGDNDLLVVNRKIGKQYQSHPGETCYFLENDGRGRFYKKSHKILPDIPASAVYLLDANGTGVPDAIILSDTGAYYLIGRDPWVFSVDTERRLPHFRRMDWMTFGDTNDDGYLDIFGIASKNKRGRLWLNRFD